MIAHLFCKIYLHKFTFIPQGYNCTVFAYGQTGTGKTFTMEGQFGDSSFSNMYSNAGVVPRAVEHVFKHLEENDLEYQVLNGTLFL